MNSFSLKDAARLTKSPSIKEFFDGPQWTPSKDELIYLIPKDSGVRVALAKTIGGLFASRGACLLWINEPHIWPSSEHPDIFARYRLSFGEQRMLSEAPVDHFNGLADRESLISILSICLLFVWGFELAALDSSAALTVSHDEWLEYRSGQGADFAPDFRKWIEPFLEVRELRRD